MLLEFISKFVSVVAMNEDEALSLTGISDPLLAAESVLDLCDMVLLTVGARGLYIGALVDSDVARPTKEALHTK